MALSSQSLIFGTANLLTTYGQKSIYINSYHSKKLITFAFRNSIKILDISTDYKIFKKNIFKHKNINWKICFKITNKILIKLNSRKKIDKFINLILNKFNCNKIDYFLFHHENDLLTKNGKFLYKELLILKKKKLIQKIGISTYDIKKLFKIIKNFPIDIIQIPFNVLDQRLDNKQYIKFFKKKNIEIHARSIFLQGILVDKELTPKKIKKDKKLQMWFNYINKNNLNPIKETFNFISNKKYIKKIIIGARSKEQLNEIISNLNIKKKFNYSIFKSKKIKTIDPRKW